MVLGRWEPELNNLLPFEEPKPLNSWQPIPRVAEDEAEQKAPVSSCFTYTG